MAFPNEFSLCLNFKCFNNGQRGSINIKSLLFPAFCEQFFLPSSTQKCYKLILLKIFLKHSLFTLFSLHIHYLGWFTTTVIALAFLLKNLMKPQTLFKQLCNPLFSFTSTTGIISYCLYCLDATDLNLSQLIWPAARGRRNDEIRLIV